MTVRAVGIDPGASTGVVCVDLVRADTIVGARFVAAVTCRASASKDLTDAEQDASLGVSIRRTLDLLHGATTPIAFVVLEEPADGMGKWSTQGRKTGRGTAFGLGRAYGLALAAAAALDGNVGLHAYPVTTTAQGRAAGRLGWMQGRQPRPTPREDTLATMRHLARALGCATHASLTDDQLMALGVLQYHVVTQSERVATVQQLATRKR